jgi:hypothetical protein
MTKRWVASLLLIMMAIIVAWYVYQEYLRYQYGPERFIEATETK